MVAVWPQKLRSRRRASLGDPATGEELGITPPLTSTQMARNHGRRVLGGRMRRGALVGVAVAAAAGLATYGFFAPRPASSGLSGGLQASVLRHAEAATVRLLMGSEADATGSGSGTVISPSGLILTNSHVAQPHAPGLAVSLEQPQTDPNPPFLTVEMTTGPSSPVIARYRARRVAVDGYVDLAVVQIYATASGKPVSPGSLHLPYLTLGNVDAVQLDQNVTTLGFPGMSGSDSITVTSGVVDTFVPDPGKHVKDPRFELETTAKIGHGNSGGAAINNAGQLIGVPSLGVPGQDSDVSWRLRSVAEAKPLIAAVRKHAVYHSKILVQMTGTESVSQVGVGTNQEACGRHRGRADRRVPDRRHICAHVPVHQVPPGRSLIRGPLAPARADADAPRDTGSDGPQVGGRGGAPRPAAAG